MRLFAIRNLLLAAGFSAVLSGCQNYGCGDAGIAVDDAGRIITSTSGPTHLVYTSPNSTILSRIKTWPTVPPGEENSHIAWPDYALSSNDFLYLLRNTWDHPNVIYRVNLSNGAAEFIGDRLRAVKWTRPDFLATDKRGRAYVASVDGMAVTVVALSEPREKIDRLRVRKFTIPGNYSVSDFAAASDGTLYFSSTKSDAIIMQVPGVQAKVLRGSRTGLNAPAGIDVDSSGRLYVANHGGGGITVYAAHAHGNVSPARSLHNNAFTGPRDIAVDNRGFIYVANGPEQTTAPAGSQSLLVLSPDGTLVKRFNLDTCGAIPL